MTLLIALARLQKFYPVPFTVEAISLDMGGGQDFSPVTALCKELDVPYSIVQTEIAHIIFDVRKEKNPCSMCAKMRRGALHEALKERGINKIALGHHYDDAVETFLLSLFFEGRLSCFQPVTWLDRSEIWQIRPLLYCGESKIRGYVAREDVPIVHNPCPANGITKRQEVKDLLEDLKDKYPDLKSKIFGSMQRFPLPEWEPKEHRRRPLPVDVEDEIENHS